MRVAIAVLCIGAVTFLLRVLVALAEEWMQSPRLRERLHLARLNSPQSRGELIVMNPEVRERQFPSRAANG